MWSNISTKDGQAVFKGEGVSCDKGKEAKCLSGVVGM
jgi:hypothetical protein